jgi:hypothetical protein
MVMMVVAIALSVSEGVELELLLANHLEHAVNLGFLLLLEFVVDLAEAGLALVVRVTGRDGGATADGWRAG